MATTAEKPVSNPQPSTENNWPYDDEFRNNLATVSASGSRIWLYAKEVTGQFTNYRRYVAWFLIGLWVIGPFLTWQGQPLMLFGVLDRHFIILGQHFFPQDLMYFGILLLTFFIFIAVFTLTFGRVWCGWACPQTLFMEQVFRRIEYWIEGTARQQQILDQAPWTWEKIWKKSAKHTIFFSFALAIGMLVQLYVLGRPAVYSWLSAGPFSDMPKLGFWLIFSTIFYGVFSWAREQVCIAMCPYGRLQSVLMNNSSLMVVYDRLRGEPRRHKKQAPVQNDTPAGDCIDCKLCVHVCPTGIDIRNGSQLECINCTACIDACDNVMTQINKPTGLITLSSHEQIDNGGGKTWKPTRRTYIAAAIMLVLLSVDAVLLFSRSPLNATVLRVPGQLHQIGADGRVSNLYNMQLVNKSNEPMTIKASVENAEVQLINGSLALAPQGHTDVTFFVKVKPGAFKKGKNAIIVNLDDATGRHWERKTNFLAP